MAKRRFVYPFGELGVEAIDLVGGKGAYLSEMVRMGLPVPSGFTITTEAASVISDRGYGAIEREVNSAVRDLEKKTGKRFGRNSNPLLLSVRSGSRVSMPGAMETILNVGFNRKFVERSDDDFLKECYLTFLLGYGYNVLQKDDFNPKHENYILSFFNSASASDKLGAVLKRFKKIASPKRQLSKSIQAIFNSWYNERAKTYREVENISAETGTAVNVQQMVFGNKDDESLTAAFFTRSPSNGEKGLFGSFRQQSQGDRLVQGEKGESLDMLPPKIRKYFQKFADILEFNLGDMQEIEATVESGVPYVLQTRAGRRTTKAGVKILMDLAKEGKISEAEALSQIDVSSLELLDQVQIKSGSEGYIIGRGTAVSPGIAYGFVSYNLKHIRSLASRGRPSILVKKVLDVEDIAAMDLVDGILTCQGEENLVSHALVVARGKNKPCITGVPMGGSPGCFSLGSMYLYPEEKLTLDANNGKVYYGKVPLQDPSENAELSELFRMTERFCSNGALSLIQDPNEVKTLVHTDGILYAPSLNDVEGVALRKSLVDSSFLKSFLNMRARQYVKFFNGIKNKSFSPLVMGLMSLEDLAVFGSNRDIIDFRREVLQELSAKKLTLTEKFKPIKFEVGAEFPYKGQTIKIMNLHCSCGGWNVKGSKSGSFCVAPSKMKEINNPFGGSSFDFSARVKNLGGEVPSKRNLKSTYRAQKKMIQKLAKERQLKVNFADLSSGGEEIVVGGKHYVFAPSKEIVKKRLSYVQEVMRNGS